MAQSREPVGGEIRLPGIRVWSNDISGLFRRHSNLLSGPFVLICRPKELAVDTALQYENGCWPEFRVPDAYQPQLWHFKRTAQRGEYLIVSVANGLALDSRGTEHGRIVTMRSPDNGEHQRWRLSASADGAAFVIESVLTRHVLDGPRDTDPRTNIIMWDRHDGVNQQFLVMAPSGGKVR